MLTAEFSINETGQVYSKEKYQTKYQVIERAYEISRALGKQVRYEVLGVPGSGLTHPLASVLQKDPEYKKVVLSRENLYRFWNRYMNALENCLKDNTETNRHELDSAKQMLRGVEDDVDQLLKVE